MNCKTKIENWNIYQMDPTEYVRGCYPSESLWGECFRTEHTADVHTVLIESNVIPDPAYGTADKDCAWVEKAGWIYQGFISCSADLLAMPVRRLVFNGVDTYADLFINGCFVRRFEDMFLKYTVDVSEYLKEGMNEILTVFESMPLTAAEKKLPEGFWINYSTERAFTRKAGYSYGWDWTPRVATVGLWKSVEFICGDAVFDEVSAYSSVEESLKSAIVYVQAEYSAEEGVSCIYILSDMDGNKVASGKLCGNVAEIHIDDPKLWWTRDMGTPYLYSLTVNLERGGMQLDYRVLQIGIRSLEIVREGEDGTGRYLFMLNGRPLFLRGANWVPMSNRPASVSDEQYGKMISLAADANMNFLIAWGGGIYEPSIFYDLCDRYGILVWQYFMFACGEYPDYDVRFVDIVREECRQAVYERRHHACIAVWIGNVENEMICQKIGLSRHMYGEHLFEEFLPEWMTVWDPSRQYVPSSPWGTDLMNSMTEYDRHNWDLWFGNHPYTDYLNDECCFCSEFGIHASPVSDSVKRFCGKDELTPDSFEFRYLNRDADPERMYYYLRTHTGEPKTLEEYVNLTMLVQAEALSCACDHFRRRFPKCGGAAVWQLNDCCGVHSWSIIDYDFRPKAAYYAVKRSFADVCLNIHVSQPNHVEIFICNNGRATTARKVIVEVSDYFGEKAYEKSLDVIIPPGKVFQIDSVDLGGRFYPNAILRNRPRLYFAAAYFDGDPASLRTASLCDYKDRLLPPARLKVVRRGNNVTVSSDTFSQFTHIGCEDSRGLYPDDNYFDLLPGAERTITVEGYSEGVTGPLRISSLNCKEQIYI